VKHWYQINRYCKLLNKQKLINGCWKLDFDKILLTHCKYKSLIWIYRWTRCATRWQPTQFREIGSLPWNRTRVGSSGLLTTWTANLSTVRFGPRPGPEVTVRNRWEHYRGQKSSPDAERGLEDWADWFRHRECNAGRWLIVASSWYCDWRCSYCHWGSRCMLVHVIWPNTFAQLCIDESIRNHVTSCGSLDSPMQLVTRWKHLAII